MSEEVVLLGDGEERPDEPLSADQKPEPSEPVAPAEPAESSSAGSTEPIESVEPSEAVSVESVSVEAVSVEALESIESVDPVSAAPAEASAPVGEPEPASAAEPVTDPPVGESTPASAPDPGSDAGSGTGSEAGQSALNVAADETADPADVVAAEAAEAAVVEAVEVEAVEVDVVEAAEAVEVAAVDATDRTVEVSEPAEVVESTEPVIPAAEAPDPAEVSGVAAEPAAAFTPDADTIVVNTSELAPAAPLGSDQVPSRASWASGKVIFAVVAGLLLLLAGIAGGMWVSGGEKPTTAAAGDCLTSSGIDPGSGKKQSSLKIVDCGKPAAKYRVMGRVDRRAESEANAKSDLCDPFPGTEFIYWEGPTGKKGTLLCLAANK